MSYSNFNTFKLFENVGINSSSDYMLSMRPNDNNVSFHSSNSIDYNNVDIMSIKNIINKAPNEDLNLSCLNGTTINPVITINNNNQDCRIMTNLNVSGNVNLTKNLNISGNINFTNSCIGYYKKPIFSNIDNINLDNYGDLGANTDGSGLILESGEPGSAKGTEGGGIKIVSDGVAIWGPGNNTNPSSSKSAIFVVYDEEKQSPGLTITASIDSETGAPVTKDMYYPSYQPRFKICKNGWTMINTNHYSKVFKVSRISIKLYEDKYRRIVWDNTSRQCSFTRLSDIPGITNSPPAVTSYLNLTSGSKSNTWLNLPIDTPGYWSATSSSGTMDSSGSLGGYGQRILAMFGYEDTEGQDTSTAYLYNNLWGAKGHFWTFDVFCGEPSQRFGNVIIKMEAFVDAENNILDWTI